MLVKLSKDILIIYRELYRNNWPKHIVTFTLLNHFIDRFNKFPEWERKVHFNRLDISDVKVDYDATFMFQNGSHIYFDSLTADNDKLSKLLNLVNYKEEKTFITIRDEFRNLIDDIIRIKFLERTFDSGAKCFNYAATESQIEEIILKMPKEFYVDNLKETDIEMIDNKWIQKFSGSKEYLKLCFDYNPSTGFYRLSDNKLVGWSITLETGAMGNAYIDENFRRQSLGKLLMATHMKRLAKVGRNEKIGFILHYNDISLKMSSNIPNTSWVNNVSSIGVRRKIFDGNAPLWGRKEN